VDLPRDVGLDLDRLNRLLASQRALPAKLEAVAEIVQRTLPGCDAVSVALIVEEAAMTGAASSQLAIEADLVQYRHQDGPCLEAAGAQATVRIDALEHDERFEHFAPGAIDLGVESVLSIPLLSGDISVGSLNLYSQRSHAFPTDAPEQIAHIAAYAVEVIVESELYASTVDLVQRLVEVVEDAGHVEIAVGALLLLRGMTHEEAWAHLHRLVVESGQSIVECARQVSSEVRGRPDDA
jgi:GAF domain-containing protein